MLLHFMMLMTAYWPKDCKPSKSSIKPPKKYKDYRKLLEDPDIEVVIKGTPDHWHCLQLTDTLEVGKDMYCEKPIANSNEESTIMWQRVQTSDKMVQLGQWQRSHPHFEYVHSGKLATSGQQWATTPLSAELKFSPPLKGGEPEDRCLDQLLIFSIRFWCDLRGACSLAS